MEAGGLISEFTMSNILLIKTTSHRGRRLVACITFTIYTSLNASNTDFKHTIYHYTFWEQLVVATDTSAHRIVNVSDFCTQVKTFLYSGFH